jgi:prevent-host-death family protein
VARYSVATTKNNLSSLIDKALAGEEVVITRHGKPLVALSVVSADDKVSESRLAARHIWMDRLQALRDSLPQPLETQIDSVRGMRDEHRY